MEEEKVLSTDTDVETEVNADTEIVSSNELVDGNSQARRFMLTINNPTETDEDMCQYIESLEHFKYSALQRERGHEAGTEHFQIFLVFTIGKRFSTIKKLFPRAHIEKANGSNVQCRDYCTKSDTRISGPYELGVFAEERARTDIVNLMEMIKSGASDYEIGKVYPNYYFNKLDRIRQMRQELLRHDMEDIQKQGFVCVYIYGPSRVGKTYNLFNYFGNSKAYWVKQYEKNYFDEFRNQKVVIFDEFRSQIDFSIFLNLADAYPLDLSCRYNNKFGNYNTVFISSNWSPIEQYSFQRSNDYKSWQGFEKRLHFILRFESREKIILEKADKSLDDLKRVLPPSMWKILDAKYLNVPAEDLRKQMKIFEPIDDDPVF